MCEPRSKTQLNIIQLMGKETKGQMRKKHLAVQKAFEQKVNGAHKRLK